MIPTRVHKVNFMDYCDEIVTNPSAKIVIVFCKSCC